MSKFWKALCRRKTKESDESDLARVLNLFDLTALGVGSTLGLGVYVLAGFVAYHIAGPAVVISFVIAAISSAFACLCYAEFAGRVPRAGSAYEYGYVTLGEFVAFSIGWVLVMEYSIGTASVACGLSSYIDSLIGQKMSKALTKTMYIDVNFLANYPDFLGFGFAVLLTAVLAVGVNESSLMNKIFTGLNMLTIFTIILCGSIKADPKNWSIPQSKIPNKKFGVGGFMPYGVSGIMAGAAKCFFGFVGFDCIATLGEETINPRKNIPLAFVISVVVIFLSYFGVSTVLTMMCPYYTLDPAAPITTAFANVNWTVVKWIVTIGAIPALCASALGAMIPLPRVLYAMGKDRVIFNFFGKVNSHTKTPLIATLISGTFTAIMSLLFDLDQLIDMMSIGTLLVYTLVSVCVLILRYKDEDMLKEVTFRAPYVCKQLFNCNCIKEPTRLTSMITIIAIFVFAIFCLVLCTLTKIFRISSFEAKVSLSIVGAGLVFICLIIALQPQSSVQLTFKVPLVPFIPCLSTLINLYLMFQLGYQTWIQCGIWLVIGYIIYFSYGIRNSQQNHPSPSPNDQLNESKK